MKIKVLSLIIFFVALLPYALVKADVNQGITLAPISADIKLKVEQEYKGSFTIRNNEQNNLNIEFKEADLNDGQVTNESNLYWFSIDSTKHILDANSDLQVEYTVKIPTDTTPGRYSKAILIKLVNTSEGESTFNLSLTYAVNIYVESLFNNELGTRIKEFYSDSKLIFENKVNLNLNVENASGFSKPLINLNIINPSGKIVYTTVLNESLQTLREQKTYKVTASWPNINLFDIGPYTAQALVTDTLTGKTSVNRITFFNLNWLYFGIILLVFVGGVFFLRFVRGLIKIIKINRDVNSSENLLGVKKDSRKRGAK